MEQMYVEDRDGNLIPAEQWIFEDSYELYGLPF
jgi:hypothetical protein